MKLIEEYTEVFSVTRFNKNIKRGVRIKYTIGEDVYDGYVTYCDGFTLCFFDIYRLIIIHILDINDLKDIEFEIIEEGEMNDKI